MSINSVYFILHSRLYQEGNGLIHSVMDNLIADYEATYYILILAQPKQIVCFGESTSGLYFIHFYRHFLSARSLNQALLVFLALDIVRWQKPNVLDCAVASALQVTSVKRKFQLLSFRIGYYSKVLINI